MTLVNKSVRENAADSNGRCVAGTLGDCTFSVDSVTGRCRAEFQGVHVENSFPQTRSSFASGWKLDKYAFHFETMVHVCGCDIRLQTLSTPVIVTGNAFDDVIARGILIWDAAFSESGRKPFVCRDIVRWSEFKQMLNMLFVTNTGRGLDPSHLDYLARFLFNENRSSDFNNRIVREKQVIWDFLTGRPFSFWTWFWANLAVCRDVVKEEWKAGVIYGFISKEDARSKLLDSPRGTFLLRFSESDIDRSDARSIEGSCDQKTETYGHLTIAVTECDANEGNAKKMYYIKDYLSPRHVKDKSLFEILRAMEVADSTKQDCKKPLLEYLWPDTSKSFHTYFSPPCGESDARRNLDQVEDENGYKPSKFKIEIFLTETKCVGNRIPRQDSMSSTATATSLSAHSSMNDVSVDDGNVRCASSSPTPQYALRLTAETARPRATVRPQPPPAARPVMPSTARYLLPAPNLVNGQPNAAANNITDDESSMDTAMAASFYPEAAVAGALSFAGNTFTTDFAAFNLNGSSG